jgi:hypothetical protein
MPYGATILHHGAGNFWSIMFFFTMGHSYEMNNTQFENYSLYKSVPTTLRHPQLAAWPAGIVDRFYFEKNHQYHTHMWLGTGWPC